MSAHRSTPAGLRIALAALLVVVTACGARLSEQELAAATAGGDGGAATGGASARGGTATATTAAAAAGGQAPAAAQPGAPAAGGGGGETGGGSGGGPAACTSGGAGTDPGVAADSIKVGWVGTISGPVSGFSKTAQNGVKAYFEYINATEGGVCGRRLELIQGDDGLDSGRNRSETQRLAGEVFAFVGGLSVVDDGGAGVLAGTNIPDVGLAISDPRIALPNNFSTNPIPATGNGTQNLMAYFKNNEGVTSAAIVFPAQATARKRALAYEQDMAQAGIPVTLKAEVSVTQTDYNGVASQIKNAGVTMVITTLEITGMARLAQALQQQGYVPKVPFYGAQAYSQRFLDQAGPAGEGTKIGIAYSIVEGPQSPGMAAFAEWYPRVSSNGDPDFFAIQSWAAGDLFVQALQAAGPTPTRDAVLAALQQMTDFDAHGVLAPHTNPAGKAPSPCYMIAGVQGGQWYQAYPESGFAC